MKGKARVVLDGDLNNAKEGGLGAIFIPPSGAKMQVANIGETDLVLHLVRSFLPQPPSVPLS